MWKTSVSFRQCFGDVLHWGGCVGDILAAFTCQSLIFWIASTSHFFTYHWLCLGWNSSYVSYERGRMYFMTKIHCFNWSSVTPCRSLLWEKVVSPLNLLLLYSSFTSMGLLLLAFLPWDLLSPTQFTDYSSPSYVAWLCRSGGDKYYYATKLPILSELLDLQHALNDCLKMLIRRDLETLWTQEVLFQYSYHSGSILNKSFGRPGLC